MCGGNGHRIKTAGLLVLALAAVEHNAQSRGIATAPATDFSQPEPGERLPGGDTTSKKSVNRNAFSHNAANLPFEKELDFKVGNGFFRRIWVSAPASTQSADGLGPLYNARACQRCHLKDGRGHPPAANYPDDTAVSMFLRLSIPPQNAEQKSLLASRKVNVIPEPTYGGQLQDFSIQGIPAEGRMHIEYEEIAVPLNGGEIAYLRKPRYTVTDLQYGAMHAQVMISPRVAPPMIGLGLLEMVPAADILAHADPDDSDGDGISGRPNRVWDIESRDVAIGRFGWKAGNPTINQQSQGAFSGDIGLSTPLFPDPAGDCTGRQAACRKAPHGDSPQHGNLEVSAQVSELVLFYSRHLAVPARRNAGDAQVLQGKKLFYESGCTGCHVPKFLTGSEPDRPELSKQLIWPYSDLLVHDMGEGLADGRPEGVANGREWRTSPLWGIGLTKVVNGHTYFLHDGRARNLLEAVLWHGGEAEPAQQSVVGMTPEQRGHLLAFLGSL